MTESAALVLRGSLEKNFNLKKIKFEKNFNEVDALGTITINISQKLRLVIVSLPQSLSSFLR